MDEFSSVAEVHHTSLARKSLMNKTGMQRRTIASGALSWNGFHLCKKLSLLMYGAVLSECHAIGCPAWRLIRPCALGLCAATQGRALPQQTWQAGCLRDS